MPTIYRIHPAIGMARVGDSPNEYFVGQEAPGFPPSLNRPDSPHDPSAGYKDDQGRIKRQGARFRIYEYTLGDAGALIQRERSLPPTHGSSGKFTWQTEKRPRPTFKPRAGVTRGKMRRR
jgi:hypothetical protein